MAVVTLRDLLDQPGCGAELSRVHVHPHAVRERDERASLTSESDRTSG